MRQVEREGHNANGFGDVFWWKIDDKSEAVAAMYSIKGGSYVYIKCLFFSFHGDG